MISDIQYNNYELILTENCNLRCKYCFDDAYSNRTSCDYDYKMDINMIDDILQFIDETKSKVDAITVSFFGGEPTMNWEFIEKFVEKSIDKNFKYIINSNLLLLDSKKIDFLVDNKIYPIISIDGIRKAHDVNRVKINGENSWDETMEVLPELVAKFRSVNINPAALMVISNNNYQFLEESYKFLISLGLGVNILYNFSVVYTDEELESIRNQLISLFKVKKLRPYIDIEKRVLNTDFYQQKNFCNTPQTSITIAPNKKTYFCHQLVPKMYDDKNEEYYGNIYNGITNIKYYNKMSSRINIDEFKLNKKCETCKAVAWCKGGCLANMRINSNDYATLSPTLCKINNIIDEIFRQ